jgi:hypothetical protein
MHGTALTGTKWRARRTHARRSLRARTLKNGLAGNGASGNGASGCRPSGSSNWSSGLRDRRSRTRRGSFVHRARTSLRNDNARSRRLGRSCDHRWSCRTRDRSLGGGSRRGGRSNCGGGRKNRWRRNWRNNHARRNRRLRCGGCDIRCNWRMCRWSNDRRNRLLDRLSHHSRPRRRRRNHWRRSGRNRSNRSDRSRRRPGWCRGNSRPGHDGRRSNRTRRRSFRLFFLRDGPQYIARTGDVRQVNLGFDFVIAAEWARGFGRR